MFTTEKILRYVSIAIAFITISFSVYTVINELLKPDDPFERILSMECSGRYEKGGSDISSVNDLLSFENSCVLFPSVISGDNPFSDHIFNNGLLNGFDYLFFGEKGVLVKRSEEMDLKSAATEILNCLTSDTCDRGSFPSRQKLTVTLKLIDQTGEMKASITFEDELFSQILKNSRKLLNDMVAVNELNISDLRLIAVFHGKYGYIENKDPQNISNLLKRGVDGLYLKSRGAKIRLLPHEYNDNPVAVISRKGRQYGLERDETTKDEATIYLYRTTQFGQKNRNMVQWLGRYSLEKSSYSDSFSARLISKQIRNSINRSGLFEQETDIVSGKERETKESFLIQAVAALALMRHGLVVDDEETVESAAKAIMRLAKTVSPESTALEKALLYRILSTCDANCSKAWSDYSLLKISFDDALEYIADNPVQSGLVIDGLYDMEDEKKAGLIENSFTRFEQMGSDDKVRYLGYLFSINVNGMPLSRKALENIVSKTETFVASTKYDHRGFPDFRGGIGTEERLYPGILLTASLASGLSNLISSGIGSQFIVETEAEAGNFLRFVIVTEDDYGYWGSPHAKSKVQGGVRSHLRAGHVRLINSAFVLSYFVDRISSGRDR